jgi:hypothetical protein
MKKNILLSVFGVVSIILFSFSSRSFLRKSSTIDFEITNGTGENIDSIAIYPHDSNDMHLVVLKGGTFTPNEIETYTIDGVDGDYDIVFHETNGKYLKNDFIVVDGGKADEVDLNNTKSDEGDLTKIKADEDGFIGITNIQSLMMMRRGVILQKTTKGNIQSVMVK